uniref:WD repeat-containing protein 79 n=2 Tax=Acrobeloides nanus TaxID=290746 RepID=A0A914CDD7_9BILA
MPTTESDSKIDIVVEKEETLLSTEPTLCNEDSLSKSTPQISSLLASQEKSEDSEAKAQGPSTELESEKEVENEEEDKALSVKTTKRIAKFGVAFLLAQMRNDTPNETNTNINPTSNSATTSSSSKITPTGSKPDLEESQDEPVTKRPRVALTYKIFNENEGDKHAMPIELLLEPCLTIRDCFNSGTAPNFRFSTQIKENNYVRSCSWSRDGDWLLTDSEDRIARIFRFKDNQVESHKAIPAGDLIYDTEWHPHRDIFASTSKDQPIHLIDADGNRVLTFRGINDLDELSYAHSLSFSLDGKKLSRDGDWLLTDSEDRIARVFRFKDNQVESHKAIPAGDLIYDTEWHPHRDIFASTSKDQPIHLIDADGNRVLTFRGINDLVVVTEDELSYAHSLSFSLDGKKLYAGYYKAIRIFDMERPGRQVNSIVTFQKESIGGQKSIISCIAQNPIFPGLYATASYGHSIGFYSEQTGQLDSLINADSSGITHIQYSQDGNLLYCGCRRTHVIEVFDLRFPGQVLANLERPADTNQRIFFQTNSTDKYLFSGSSIGHILIHDLSDMGQFLEPKKPYYSIPVSKAVVSGLSLHPTVPMVAVTTGQRVFPKPIISESDSEDSADENEYVYLRKPEALDNSLRLFSL